MTAKAPRGERLTIVLAGRRNVGKSSLINALAGQDISIVSDIPGTTTDPVRKAYELLPLGPVTFVDTAGIDDIGDIGKLRTKKSYKALKNADIVLLVANGDYWKEEAVLESLLKNQGIPYIIVFNKSDIITVDENIRNSLSGVYIEVSALKITGIDLLKHKIFELVPERVHEKSIIGDIVSHGDMVVLVVPIDLAAPKGRLILPQVQTIRDLLDNDCVTMIAKERELELSLEKLCEKPKLVICDSQVVLKVVGDLPENQPVTTFSTLFARYKGDLEELVKGTEAIDKLKDGDKVLIAEACSHHIQSDDIGRVKIPRWIRQYTGAKLTFDVACGMDYPENLSEYKLVIHCGGCMITQKEFRNRIRAAHNNGIPATNYGVCISKVQGVLNRILKPFPEFLYE